MDIWKEQLRKSRHSLSQSHTDKLFYCINSKENGQCFALACFITHGLCQNLPNSVDRSVNTREQREKGEKKEKTDQNKVTFEVNEHVSLQDQNTKKRP